MFRFLFTLAAICHCQFSARLWAVWRFRTCGSRCPVSWTVARLRRELKPIFVMLGLGLTPVVSAHAEVVSRLQAMHVPDLIWQPVQHMDVAAIPLHVKPFTSVQSVAWVAERLAQNQDLFQHILVSPGLAVLSGVHEEAHWLAEIWHVSDQSEGSAGRVSVLSFSGLSSLPAAEQQAYAWLPVHAKKLAQWHDGAVTVRGHVPEPASAVTQTLYRLSSSAARSRSQIAARLGSQGWSSQAVSTSDAREIPWEVWQRQNETLFLFFLNTPQGFFLYVHHTR